MSDLAMAQAREAQALDWLQRMERTVMEAKRDVKIARLAVLDAQGAGDCIEAWWVRAWLACDEPEAAFGSDE